MAHDAVAARYAESLFGAAKAQRRLEETLEQMAFLRGLLANHPPLRELLYNPDVDPDEKVGILGRVLTGRWSDLVQAFVRMVIAMDRVDSLPGIAEAFQEAVDRDQGRLRVLVRSARVMPDAVLARLREGLERRERKTVQLDTAIDPQLLGGLQVQFDDQLIDGSVRRWIDELRERLTSVRV